MLVTTLDLSLALIFVAGAAGLAAFTTLVAKFFTVVDMRLPSLTGSDKPVRTVVPVAAGRGCRATVRAERWRRDYTTSAAQDDHLAHRSGPEAAESGVGTDWAGGPTCQRSKTMGNDGRTWIGRQREGLICRRQDLWRDLEELALASVPVKTSARQARRDRRDRIAAELDDIETHLADLNVDERNIGSMEGRE